MVGFLCTHKPLLLCCTPVRRSQGLALGQHLRTGLQLAWAHSLKGACIAGSPWAQTHHPHLRFLPVQTPGTLCEVVPSSVALGGPRLALRHLLSDHRARPLGQLPAFAPLHHPVGTHQPEEAEPLRQPPGGAALCAVIRRNHLLQVGPGVWTGPSVPPCRSHPPVQVP